jgi:hypothetical protein
MVSARFIRMQPVLSSDVSMPGKSDDSPLKRSAALALMQGARGGGEAEARTGDSFRLRWQQAMQSVGDAHHGEGEEEKSTTSRDASEAEGSQDDSSPVSSPSIVADPSVTAQARLLKPNVTRKQHFVLQDSNSEPVESAGGANAAKQRFAIAVGSTSRLDSASSKPDHSAKDDPSPNVVDAPDALNAQLVPHVALAAPVAPASELGSAEADESGLKESFEKHPVSIGQDGPGSILTVGQPGLESQGLSHVGLQPSVAADSLGDSSLSECFLDSGPGAAAGVVSRDPIDRGSVFSPAARLVESHPNEAFSGSQQGNRAFQPVSGGSPGSPLDAAGKADAEVAQVTASIPLSNTRGQGLASGIERAHQNRQLGLQLAGTTDSAVATGVATTGVQIQTKAAGGPHALDVQFSRGTVDQNPFAALDGGIGDRAVNWNHTVPQHAEAGYMDPALGWVTVRADLHGGNVHAAVAGSSPDSATVLGAELSGLNAHLAEKRIPIESLTIGGSPAHEMTSGNATPQGNGEQDARGSRQGSAQIYTTAHASLVSARSGAIGSEMPAVGSTGTGIHISVRV